VPNRPHDRRLRHRAKRDRLSAVNSASARDRFARCCGTASRHLNATCTPDQDYVGLSPDVDGGVRVQAGTEATRAKPPPPFGRNGPDRLHRATATWLSPLGRQPAGVRARDLPLFFLLLKGAVKAWLATTDACFFPPSHALDRSEIGNHGVRKKSAGSQNSPPETTARHDDETLSLLMRNGEPARPEHEGWTGLARKVDGANFRILGFGPCVGRPGCHPVGDEVPPPAFHAKHTPER